MQIGKRLGDPPDYKGVGNIFQLAMKKLVVPDEET
jgi:hypothetical protein